MSNLLIMRLIVPRVRSWPPHHKQGHSDKCRKESCSRTSDTIESAQAARATGAGVEPGSQKWNFFIITIHRINNTPMCSASGTIVALTNTL
jgi:hypothetical protein